MSGPIGTDEMLDRIEALEADLAAEKARADALAEKLERAVEGLEDVAGVGFDAPMTWAGTDAEWERKRSNAMQHAARAALAAIQETTHD